jgi:hypothetical protein
VACSDALQVTGSPVGHTPFNGVTRQIPGTQKSRQPIPSLSEEPKWMKLSVTSPAPAGAAMFRDHRAWHGGTPNLSQHARAIPATFWSAPWYRKQSSASGAYGRKAVIPRSIYESLSEAGQRAAADLVRRPRPRPSPRQTCCSYIRHPRFVKRGS